MKLPLLTHHQVRQRCTEQSYERGLIYYYDGMIENSVLHGKTLSAHCHGSEMYPYNVSVKLTSTRISSTRCSCPYSWEGDCKHIVALLLTYIDTPETILSVDALLTDLEKIPKSDLISVILDLLKHDPELAHIVQEYVDEHDLPP